MEKLTFWNAGSMVETISSMDEIQGMMDRETAYRVLLGSCYNRTKYKNLSKIITDIMDEKQLSIKCSPLEAARKMDVADKTLPVPEDIFCFLEKAYLDGYECLGDKWCAFLLGRLYSQERYRHIDYPKAARWLAIGAEAGIGEAEAMLGKFHLLGLGVPKDYEKAFHYLVKWALYSEENAEAMYLLGDMYYHGLHVEKDELQGFGLYNRTWDDDEAGFCIAGAQALLRIADYHLNRIGDKENCCYALECYQNAEVQFYNYVLLHPLEAQEGLRHARAGQEQARQKLESAMYNQE